MLSAVGESPVDSLSSGLFQAEQAERVLDEVSLTVQTGDWDFNREEGIEFKPNADKEILIPPNVLRIDAVRPDLKVVQRGDKLYDKKAHSFTFTSGVRCAVTWCFPFEELPEAARQYITMRASRKLMVILLGSAEREGFTQEEESKALQLLQNADSDSADYNLFDADAESAAIFYRD